MQGFSKRRQATRIQVRRRHFVCDEEIRKAADRRSHRREVFRHPVIFAPAGVFCLRSLHRSATRVAHVDHVARNRMASVFCAMSSGTNAGDTLASLHRVRVGWKPCMRVPRPAPTQARRPASPTCPDWGRALVAFAHSCDRLRIFYINSIWTLQKAQRRGRYEAEASSPSLTITRQLFLKWLDFTHALNIF